MADVTAAERLYLEHKRRGRMSDAKIAAELGLDLDAARALAWGLRDKLAPAPGETVVDRALSLGVIDARR